MAANNNKSSGTDRLNNQLLATLETRRELTCTASVSVRVWRESWDESKKRNDGGGGGERSFFFSPPLPCSIFFAPALTFPQKLDWKRLLRRLEGNWSRNVSRSGFWDRAHWGRAIGQFCTLFLKTVPKAFARVNSSQFLSRFKSGEFPAKS